MVSGVSAMAILLAACGSEGSSPAAQTVPEPAAEAESAAGGEPTSGIEPSADNSTSEPRPLMLADVDAMSVGAADALVAAYGDEGGFVALVSALELGYSVDQVVAGANGGAIDGTGWIAGVDPAGDPLGLFDLADAGTSQDEPQGFAFPGRSPDESENEPPLAASYRTPESLYQQLLLVAANNQDTVETGRDLIAIILAFALVGYSMDQILDALLLDDAYYRTFEIEDADGEKVACPHLRRINESASTSTFDAWRPAEPNDSACSQKVVEEADEDKEEREDDVPSARADPDDIDGSFQGEVTEFGDDPLGDVFSVETNSVIMEITDGAITEFTVDVSATFEFLDCTDSLVLDLDGQPSTSDQSSGQITLSGIGTVIFSSPCGTEYENCPSLPWNATFVSTAAGVQGEIQGDDCGEPVPFAVELEPIEAQS